MRRRYLVIVYPARPKGPNQQSYSVGDQPAVSWITASSAKEAADSAHIPPGGKAEVAAKDNVTTFTRAEFAPLVSDEPQQGVA